MKRLLKCLKWPCGISWAGTDSFKTVLLLFGLHTSNQDASFREKGKHFHTLLSAERINKRGTLESILKTDSSKRVRMFKAAES